MTAHSYSRQQAEGDFLAAATERQDIYCTHGFEGSPRKIERCRQCVIEEAVNQIHALRHDIERALSNHNLDLNRPSGPSQPFGDNRFGQAVGFLMQASELMGGSHASQQFEDQCGYLAEQIGKFIETVHPLECGPFAATDIGRDSARMDFMEKFIVEGCNLETGKTSWLADVDCLRDTIDVALKVSSATSQSVPK